MKKLVQQVENRKTLTKTRIKELRAKYKVTMEDVIEMDNVIHVDFVKKVKKAI